MRHLAKLLALAALLSACGGQPVEPSYYLLRSEQPQATRALAPDPVYAMGAVALAPYLDQSGLVLETGAGEMRPAQQHLWAEPMYSSVRTFLQVEISSLRGRDLLEVGPGSGDTVLEVKIDQLHGTQGGDARLLAYWSLRRDGELVASYQFNESRSLDDGSYAALARAERALLAQLAARIADSMGAP